MLLGRAGRGAVEACDDGPHSWAAAVSQVACDAAMPDDMCQASSRSHVHGEETAAQTLTAWASPPVCSKQREALDAE